MAGLKFDLKYEGGRAAHHQLDFYDAAQALLGFQRSLALTTHAVLNDEVITQAPSLRGAEILLIPPEEGSWKVTATILAGVFAMGTASKDTPIGHLVGSAYDYVVSQTLGFHVDYNKTLGAQYEEAEKKKLQIPNVKQSRLDAVAEKCEVAVREMHRPIVASESADAATISTDSYPGGRMHKLDFILSRQTYEHMRLGLPGSADVYFVGRVSGYNVNTFKGRVFIQSEARPISFELSESARTADNAITITRSLAANAGSRQSPEGLIEFHGIPFETRAGKLKSFVILDARPA